MHYEAWVECGFYATRVMAKSLRMLKVRAKKWADGVGYSPIPPVILKPSLYGRYREIYVPRNWTVPNGTMEFRKEPTKVIHFEDETIRWWRDPPTGG